MSDCKNKQINKNKASILVQQKLKRKKKLVFEI